MCRSNGSKTVSWSTSEWPPQVTSWFFSSYEPFATSDFVSCPIVYQYTPNFLSHHIRHYIGMPQFLPHPMTLSEALLPAIQLCQQQVQQLRSCKASCLESRHHGDVDSPWIFLGTSSETRWSLRCPFRRFFPHANCGGKVLPQVSRWFFLLNPAIILSYINV